MFHFFYLSLYLCNSILNYNHFNLKGINLLKLIIAYFAQKKLNENGYH